jgi:hypothetical protein
MMPILCLGLLLSQSSGSDEPGVHRKKLAMATQFDFGQIMSGRGIQPQAGDVGEQFLQRTGVWLTQEVSIDEKLQVKIGVGGMFWYSLPEAKAGEEGAHKLLTKFGPGISQAQATYLFGDPSHSGIKLQMGLFPYKYNSEAKNLGEYLLRSGTYPGILRTGGWNFVSSASYMLQGLRLNIPLWQGRFQSDFLLPMERDLPPMHDVSPTYVASLMPWTGVEFGGGLCWNHGIPVQPSKTSPRDSKGDLLNKNPGNAYFVKRINTDTATNRTVPFLFVRDSTRFYTFQGLKMMGRFSFDPKIWLGKGPFGQQDLKLYGEVALLGWKNYPVLYEKKSERIPVMLGVNLPTFDWLEVLAFEVEHYGSKFPDNFFQVYNNRLPIPHWSEDWPSKDSVANYAPEASEIRRDNWKWSIVARKQIIGGIRILAQAASDHMRPYEYNVFPFWAPVTNRNGKDWYYLCRIEMAI